MAAKGGESELSTATQILNLTEFLPSAESGELDKELFLQALRGFACLWNTSDANYKNRTMKMNAWNCLSQMFNQEGK